MVFMPLCLIFKMWWSCLVFLLTVICNGAEFVVVRVEQGLLRGELRTRSTGNGQYYSFKGIPYAEPPIKELRFKAPRPALPWAGIRQATEHGPVCPQTYFYSNKYIPGNENCLFLNVYTPTMNLNTSLPVMVFIHGGGYFSGSGNDDNYGPDFFMDNKVVLVTFNYRLGALGFLSLDHEDAPGNAGMKDQVAALRWVSKNIQQFGGNPNNVTLFGQSVGGSSVTEHVLSPMSKGLFKRGIAMSGVVLHDYGRGFEAKRHAFILCLKLGLYTQDGVEAFKFLQNASVEAIVRAQPSVIINEKTKTTVKNFEPFGPVVEKDFGGEHFITECPIKLIKTGKINDVEMMVGFTSQEEIYRTYTYEDLILAYFPFYRELLLPFSILYMRGPKEYLPIADRIHDHYMGNKSIALENMKEFIQLFSALNAHVNYRFVEMWPRNFTKLYFYEFSCYSERNVNGKYGLKYGVKGAAHSDDLMYLFNGKKYNLPIDKNKDSYKMIVQTSKLFTNFAKHGNPTPDNSLGAVWEMYKSHRSYLNIDLNLTLKRIEVNSDFNFWRSIYESAGLTFA